MERSTRLGIGLLGGAGEAAEGHIRGFQEDSRAEVVALWDIDQVAARRRAEALKVPHVEETAESLISRNDVDAVVLCTPDHLHARHASLAL